MYLQPLGIYGPFAGGGHACSGYLVGDDENHVLMDCGSGVLSRLVEAIDISELSAVVLTHLHGDHMSDMLVLRYALASIHHKVTVYLPGQPEDIYALLARDERYHVSAEEEFSIGALDFSLHPMLHPVPTRAVCVESGGKKIFYTGDGVLQEDLFEAAHGADILLCDSWALGDTVAPHMSAQEAARLAAGLDVDTLLLTHLDYRNDPQAYLNEAQPIFAKTDLAREMIRYDLGGIDVSVHHTYSG